MKGGLLSIGCIPVSLWANQFNTLACGSPNWLWVGFWVSEHRRAPYALRVCELSVGGKCIYVIMLSGCIPNEPLPVLLLNKIVTFFHQKQALLISGRKPGSHSMELGLIHPIQLLKWKLAIFVNALSCIRRMLTVFQLDEALTSDTNYKRYKTLKGKPKFHKLWHNSRVHPTPGRWRDVWCLLFNKL